MKKSINLEFKPSFANKLIFEYLCKNGVDPWVAHFVSCRAETVNEAEEIIQKKSDLSLLLDEQRVIEQLGNGGKRLADALRNNERILFIVDFDVDGISSGAVFKSLMSHVEHKNYEILISHRKKWGYGVTEKMVEHIKNNMKVYPELVITADLGSNDEERIKDLVDFFSAQGKKADVIVTDHHHIATPPEGDTLVAFINPQKDKNPEVEKAICGAVVAHLLCREAIYRMNESPKNFDDKVLGHLALATVADVMSLKKNINRTIVKEGVLSIIQSDSPSWRIIKNENSLINEELFGFSIAPAINAVSRMGHDGYLALDFLTAVSLEQADAAWREMVGVNAKRRENLDDMMFFAYREAKKQIEFGNDVICIYVRHGNHGINGIVAGRLVEKYHRPAIVFSDGNDGILAGSCRSYKPYDIHKILDGAKKLDKGGSIIGFGGHSLAAGISLKGKGDVSYFSRLVNKVFGEMHPKIIEKVFFYDFDLNKMSRLPVLDDLYKFEGVRPFGHEFPSPVFHLRGVVKKIAWMGKENKVHARVVIQKGGKDYEVIFFNLKLLEEEDEPFHVGDKISTLLSLSENIWNGNKKLQMIAKTYKKH